MPNPLKYLQKTRQRLFDLLSSEQSTMIEKDNNRQIFCMPSEITDNMFEITDAAASRIAANGKYPWLKRKIDNSISEKKIENISAILAEMRVYDELLSFLSPGQIHSDEERKEGPDFKIDLSDREVWIEVCCPDINIYNYNFYEIGNTTNFKHVSWSRTDPRITEDGRPKTRETSQGEIAKKLSEQKLPEKTQFSESEFSVLWMDFNDPTRWRRNVSLDYCVPIIGAYNRITSGYFWYAFYVKEGEPIFDAISAGSPQSDLVGADFDGRFERGVPSDDGFKFETNIDMVVSGTSSGKSGFMNHNSAKPLSQTVYDLCLKLPNFRTEFSWLAEHSLITLKSRVDRCHQVLAELKQSFDDLNNHWRREDIINRILSTRWL